MTTIPLPPPLRAGSLAFEEVLRARRSVRKFLGEAVPLYEIAQLLWAAQGITSDQGFRTAPSAGATYPLELTLVAGRVADLAPGVYRYRPAAHDLVRLTEADRRADLADAAYLQESVEGAAAILVISAVVERTWLRYGERARRYVYMEAGHTAQNVQLQATALGLGTVPVGSFRDDDVATLLGLSAEEAPLYLIPVGRP